MPQGADEGDAAERFAADLMDKWGVGDASCNDGVLLLLTLQPRQVCVWNMPFHSCIAAQRYRGSLLGPLAQIFFLAHSGRFFGFLFTSPPQQS